MAQTKPKPFEADNKSESAILSDSIIKTRMRKTKVPSGPMLLLCNMPMNRGNGK